MLQKGEPSDQYQLALHALHVALTKDQHSQYFQIDSTNLAVYKNQRIQRYKSLARIVSRGKSSMGWFYSCKLHIAMNQFGEIACSALSRGVLLTSKWLKNWLKRGKQSCMEIVATSAKN